MHTFAAKQCDSSYSLERKMENIIRNMGYVKRIRVEEAEEEGAEEV